MPQLEKYAFFTQMFWFSLTFFAFFILLLQKILPAIARNLKFRTKLLNYYKNSAGSFQKNVLADEQRNNFLSFIAVSKNLTNRILFLTKASFLFNSFSFYKTPYFLNTQKFVLRNNENKIKGNRK